MKFIFTPAVGVVTIPPRSLSITTFMYNLVAVQQLVWYGDNTDHKVKIVRIGNTQKVITTSGTNTYDTIVATRKCTQPNENLKKIYSILKTKHQPFTKRKSVVLKPNLKKIQLDQKQKLLSGQLQSGLNQFFVFKIFFSLVTGLEISLVRIFLKVVRACATT